MTIRDRELKSTGLGGRIMINHPLAVTASKTKRPYLIATPGVPFELNAAGNGVACAAYTATAAYMLCLMGTEEIISAASLAIHSTPEQFATGAFVARANRTFVEKAAATALTFTAAHVVAASKNGVIVVQMDSAGTISTKVVSGTQSYDTMAQALAAEPAADANKVKIGRIKIANNAGAWTANTDDLTNGSDVTTATFENIAISVLDAFTGTIAPVAMKLVSGARSAVNAAFRDTSGDKDIVLLATTDANIVLTNGVFHVSFRGIGT